MDKNNTRLMKMFKYLFLFLLGGSIYYTVEVLYRGYSYLAMLIVGGLCFTLIGLINEVLEWDTYMEEQVLIGLFFTLSIEFIAGCILNLWLDLGMWDYSNMPFNLLGQICLPFALLWIPLIVAAIILDDYIRYKLFHEEKPRYRIFIYEKIKSIMNRQRGRS